MYGDVCMHKSCGSSCGGSISITMGMAMRASMYVDSHVHKSCGSSCDGSIPSRWAWAWRHVCVYVATTGATVAD